MDSVFTGSYNLNSLDENFYKVRFKQSGIDIPSNLYTYSKDKLRFTTAGPIKVDSIFTVHLPDSKRLAFKLFLKNEGNTLQINGPSVKIYCTDTWMTSIVPIGLSFPSILPGNVAACFGSTSIYYDSTVVSDTLYFNLKFEISTGGYVYWTDSLN